MHVFEYKLKNLFSWNPTKKTGLSFLLAGVMIILSLLMIPFSSSTIFDNFMSILIRDVLMILCLGVVFVSLYCKKNGNESWSEIGINKNKMTLSIILNIVLAIGLLFVFMKEGKPQNLLSLKNLYGGTYIVAAGIFEMLFIYGYLRSEFARAFGIIPSIILTSIFYSFHHAGFQPEFFHLFAVGIMYASVVSITGNLFIIFPFFWGVGALWDVLVSSTSGNGIKNVESFVVGIVIIVFTIVCLCVTQKRTSKDD